MKLFRLAVLAVVLFAFWQALSARVDPLFIVMGAASAVGVAAFSLRFIESAVGPVDDTPRVRLWPMVTFMGWLLLRIPPAGIQIAQVVLDPRRPPRPGVVRFKTNLSSPASRTLLANSITLVPGTMTLLVEDDQFTVHAFTPDAAADLASGAMQRRIAAAFDQTPDEAPEMVWEPVHDELPEEPA